MRLRLGVWSPGAGLMWTHKHLNNSDKKTECSQYGLALTGK